MNDKHTSVAYTHTVQKCWKCELVNESHPFFSVCIGEPFAMVFNFQVAGLCDSCQDKLVDKIKDIVVEFIPKNRKD